LNFLGASLQPEVPIIGGEKSNPFLCKGMPEILNATELVLMKSGYHVAIEWDF